MVSVILFGQSAKEADLLSTMSALSTQGDVERLLIAKSRPAGLEQTYKFIPSSHSTLSACTALALGMAQGDVLLLVDAEQPINADKFAEMLADLDSISAARWYPSSTGSSIQSLVDNSPAGLLQTITSGMMPSGALALARSVILNDELPEGGNLAEIFGQLIIAALSTGGSIDAASTHAATTITSSTLSEAGQARLLKALTEAANIEDIFPIHPWSEHERESAAASYHTLAALFIQFGDRESAEESLRLSDQLEDSPRSLALKGILARERGEILGAVANMVSSLQQYEIRKKENEVHYSRFQPNNLEVINDRLNAGLHALNKRDNEGALSHFTEAVFNFDSFFAQVGMSKLAKVLPPV